MATGAGERSLLGDLVVDLRRFHDRWMGLVFPRQVNARGTVLGKWTPNTTGGWIRYRLWGGVGIFVVAIFYPVALFGTAIRYQVRRIDDAVAWLGLVGVIILSAIAWGGLSVFASLRFPFEGFLAVVAAGLVATMSAVGAVLFSRVDGRPVTVAVAYPLAVTGVFLPPVVAALYSPALADIIFTGSTNLAVWLLDRLPALISEPLQARFTLVGVAYVGMWFGIAVPVGWILGSVVALADVVRPTE